MKVTEIEAHEITLEYEDWIAYQLNHFYGPAKRTVYVAHTDDGLVGLGEGHDAEPEEVVDRYIGTNPFDWIGDETSLALGTAMYDLMGKAAGVPVYQLDRRSGPGCRWEAGPCRHIRTAWPKRCASTRRAATPG